MVNPPAGPSRTVLIVDDDVGEVRQITRTLGRSGGWKVDWVDRLAAALARLDAGGVDVVLLGLPPSASRGLDTLSALAARAPQVPMVVLTGESNLSLGTEAMRLGAQDHLVRGSADGELLERVLDYAIERKRTADALVEAHKLESLGLLAGGIAHDFNNLLGVILGQTGLALSKLPARSPAQANLQKAMHSAERAADRARQMLAYAGRGAVRVGPIDVGEAVADHFHLLQAALPGNVVLRTRVGGDLPLVDADTGQLEQVLMNLVLNGVDAIGPAEGAISVAVDTCVLEDDDRRAWQRPGMPVLAAGRYVRVEVSDTGRGIEPAVMSRIFEPFFSTRQAGRGLGLATVLGIVKGHRGAIRVRSEVGGGTTVELVLPAASPRAAPAERPRVPPPVPLNGKGLVLVIEDEAELGDTAAQMLSMAGFEAVTAGDGRAGLAAYDARASEVRLVLLDLSMPVMSGEETFRELHRRDPALPIVLCSGFDATEVRTRFAAEGVAGFLQKPYTFAQLFEAIKRCLPSSAA